MVWYARDKQFVGPTRQRARRLARGRLGFHERKCSRSLCALSLKEAAAQGTDIEGGGVEWKNLSLAIAKGLATEARLDEAVRRSFKPHFDVGRFSPPNASEWSKYDIDTINSAEHRNISYEAALQSLVLLRNDGDALPLKIGSKVAVVGPQSTARSGLLSDYAGGQWC